MLAYGCLPPADVDAAEHARRRFAWRPEPEKIRETLKTMCVSNPVLSGTATAW